MAHGKSDGKVRFIRVKGRIVPIKAKAGDSPRPSGKRPRGSKKNNVKKVTKSLKNLRKTRKSSDRKQLAFTAIGGLVGAFAKGPIGAAIGLIAGSAAGLALKNRAVGKARSRVRESVISNIRRQGDERRTRLKKGKNNNSSV